MVLRFDPEIHELVDVEVLQGVLVIDHFHDLGDLLLRELFFDCDFQRRPIDRIEKKI
jgi:hypothetical protein